MCHLCHGNRIQVYYLLSWLRGVAQTLRDEILPSEGMLPVGNSARAFASLMHR